MTGAPELGDPDTDTEPGRHDVLADVSRLIAELDRHPDPAVGESVAALLGGIDAVHRTGLAHLFGAVQELGGEAFVNKLTADAAIRLLLMSYDLLAVDRRLMTEEALDAVRGHLHGHGVDVELLEVAGSEVFVKLHGIDETSLPIDAIRHDIEAALREGPIGFQFLTFGERERPKPAALVQLGGRRPITRPIYHPVCAIDDVEPGQMKAVDVQGHPVLLANVAGDIYAIANRCGETPLPLEFGTLDGPTLLCTWHACQYDVRSGARIDDPEAPRLPVYPVRVDGEAILIAMGVEDVPPGAGS